MKSATQPSASLTRPSVPILYGLASPVYIVISAFTIRFFVGLYFRTYNFPATDDHWMFAGEIGRVARSIASGHGFSSPYGGETGPTALVSPVYVYFLAGLFKIFGIYSTKAALFAITFNSFWSALTSYTIFILASRTFDRVVATIAAWAWAVFPFAIHASTGYVWETCFSTFLLSAAVCFAVALGRTSGKRMWLAYGCLWGLISLTNAALASMFPFSLLWVVLRRNRRRQNLAVVRQPALARYVEACRLPALAVIAAGVCLSPWMIRNVVTFHRAILLRSGLGSELYTATLLDQKLGRTKAYGIISSASEQRDYHKWGEVHYMDDRSRRATAAIACDPARFLRLSAQRCLSFWAGNWFQLDAYAGRNMTLLFTLYAIVSALGLASCLMALSNREPYGTLYAIPLLVYPLIYYITHVEPRYRHPIEPYLVVLMAYGFLRLSAAGTRKLRSTRLVLHGSCR